MADSEDEFMPIFVAASAAFGAMSQKICRPGVGRASAGRQYQTYLIPPADVVRASARRTTPGRRHDFWNSHDRCPTTFGRCKIGRPASLVSSRLKPQYRFNADLNQIVLVSEQHTRMACSRSAKGLMYVNINLVARFLEEI